MEILEQNLDELMFSSNPAFVNSEMYYSNCTTTRSTTSTSSQASAHGGDQHQIGSTTMNINSWNGGGQESTVLTNAAAAAVVEAPQLISFENADCRLISSSSSLIISPTSDSCNHLITPQIISFSSSSSVEDHDDFAGNMRDHRSVLTATRTPSQAQDHLISERKRRDNLRQLFIDLSKVVPGLRKLDKATLLEDAINHLKLLQERVMTLEKGEEVTTSVSADNVNFPFIETTNPSNNDYCDLGPPKITIRTTDMDVLIKICCKKQMGLLSRIPHEMEKIHLSVKDIRIMPFGQATLDVTILAQMKSDFVGTMKDIIDHLQAVLGP